MNHRLKATFIDMNGETIYRCVKCGKLTTQSRYPNVSVAETVFYIALAVLAVIGLVGMICGG